MREAIEARNASRELAAADNKTKNAALEAIVKGLKGEWSAILAANSLDVKAYEAGKGYSPVLLARLKLDDSKINGIVRGVEAVREQPDPVGQIISRTEMDEGLVVSRVRSPIGVIGVIFESRPDALVQIATLCLKSGNAVVLKGGKEAENTNGKLYDIIKRQSEESGIAAGWVQLLQSRADVSELLKQDAYVDLLIPRGSKELVRYIQANTKIPVLGHAEGICHVYVDKDADIDMALKIAYDAKCQYPAVCNAAETLLVHQNVASAFLPRLVEKLQGVELRGDEEARKIVNMEPATEQDWKTEYNDLILSVRIVNGVYEAVRHVNNYGSHHTDAIVTDDINAAEVFLKQVDSATVLHNASTRFADGFRFGLGAEVGISTSKIHARGPFGLEALTTYKNIVRGTGQVVADYIGPNAKPFTHRNL